MSTIRTRTVQTGRTLALLALSSGLIAAGLTPAAASDAGNNASAKQAKTFRVCADPNNLPFSNKAKQGFENKLADLIANELGEKVTYTWHAQRRGFVRQTLKAKKCDVVMGVPLHYKFTEDTKPYYRSTYVFISRADRHLGIKAITDKRLHKLKIGVQLIGDDGFNTPPSHALAAEGLDDNMVGFTVYGDYRKPNPPARIVTAVEHGDVDIAAVWGPLAGYFAKKSAVPLTITPITDTSSEAAAMPFQFAIAMGVRKGDNARRDMLNSIIVRKRPEIDALLHRFGIPTVPMEAKALQNTGVAASSE